jgi:flagellar basal body-associated protein FliL
LTKVIIFAGGGLALAGGIGAALFFFVFSGSGSSEATAEPTAEATPVHVEGKLGPRIVLESRVFNLRTEPGEPATYLKLETVIEFETSSEEWGFVLHGCVAEGAAGCLAEEERLLHEFDEEIGSGRTLIEDAVTSIVTAKSLVEISTPEGKEALRAEILHAVKDAVPEPHVVRVLFTDFVSQ